MTHKKDYRVIETCTACGTKGTDSWTFVNPDAGIRKHSWSTTNHWGCNYCHQLNTRNGEDTK